MHPIEVTEQICNLIPISESNQRICVNHNSNGQNQYNKPLQKADLNLFFWQHKEPQNLNPIVIEFLNHIKETHGEVVRKTSFLMAIEWAFKMALTLTDSNTDQSVIEDRLSRFKECGIKNPSLVVQGFALIRKL